MYLPLALPGFSFGGVGFHRISDFDVGGIG
jgi:hypothetical protein